MTDTATFQVGALAALVLTAHQDLDLARQEAADPDGDKAWVIRPAMAAFDHALAAWMTLLGLPLSERTEGLAQARLHRAAATVAHAAPF